MIQLATGSNQFCMIDRLSCKQAVCRLLVPAPTSTKPKHYDSRLGSAANKAVSSHESFTCWGLSLIEAGSAAIAGKGTRSTTGLADDPRATTTMSPAGYSHKIAHGSVNAECRTHTCGKALVSLLTGCCNLT